MSEKGTCYRRGMSEKGDVLEKGWVRKEERAREWV